MTILFSLNKYTCNILSLLFTGTCAVIITNGGKDRSLCANLSASRYYTDDQLEIPENQKIIQNAKLSHLRTVEKIARIAHKRNCLLLFNMSVAYIFETYMDSVMAVLPYVNIMIGSTEVSGIKCGVIK
ncbi:unnamed protein product [Aphis gossypii]|uniref:Adenosine kinase n=1 Tax=Aphis gossypii TaxID=80765 RepID=A0A9P0J2L5_APHGO|nr:unnamed protein product [Aphis gossypii]